MKKQVATFAAASLFVAGCEFGVQPQTVETYSYPPLPEGSAPAEVVTPPEAIITLGKRAMKGRLPKAVRNQIPSVVKVSDIQTDGLYGASGVKVRGGFLTSGHLFKNMDNRWESSCNEVSVEPDYRKPRKTRWQAAAQNLTSSDTRETDIAFMSPQASAEGHQDAHVSNSPKDLPKGKRVFAINYEPTAKKQERSATMKGKIKGPAIYSGYVLDDPKGNDGQIRVLTGVGKSFGIVPDIRTRPGASGGGWFTEDGRLFALTTATDESPTTVERVEDEYNVDIRGRTTLEPQITYVQPVDKEVINKIASQVGPLKDC